MNSLSFKNIPVRIGKNLHDLSYLTALNVSINTNNVLNEVKSLGFYNSYPLQMPSNFINHSISLQYMVQNNDPIKPIIENIKTGKYDNAESYYIDIGGLTFSGIYFDSFSLTANPSTVVSAQVSFISFSSPRGQFGRKIQFDKIYPRWTGTSPTDPTNTYNINNIYKIHGTGAYLIDLFSNTGQFLRSNSALVADRLYIYDSNGAYQGYYFIRSASNAWVNQSLTINNYFTVQSGYIFQLLNRASSPSLFKDVDANYIVERSGIDIDNRISGNIDADFLHGNTTDLQLSSNITNNTTEDESNRFGLTYNLKTQYIPISTLGASYPKVVKFNGAVEELELTENLYRRILYTGDTKNITINMTAICCPDVDYTISIDRSQSVSSTANLQNNGVVTTLRKFTKYY